MSVEGCGEPGGSPRFQEEGGTWGRHGFPHEREPEASVAHEISVLSGVPGPSTPERNAWRHAELREPMGTFRRWFRQRAARRLALVMRDALLPSRPGLS